MDAILRINWSPSAEYALRALKAFGEDYPEAKRLLLYRGRERLLRDGISIEPADEFLPGLV